MARYYWLPDTEYNDRQRGTTPRCIVLATNRKSDYDQGEWYVDGIPLGGFTVHPIRLLNEDQRQAEHR